MKKIIIMLISVFMFSGLYSQSIKSSGQEDEVKMLLDISDVIVFLILDSCKYNEVQSCDKYAIEKTEHYIKGIQFKEKFEKVGKYVDAHSEWIVTSRILAAYIIKKIDKPEVLKYDVAYLLYGLLCVEYSMLNAYLMANYPKEYKSSIHFDLCDGLMKVRGTNIFNSAFNERIILAKEHKKSGGNDFLYSGLVSIGMLKE